MLDVDFEDVSTVMEEVVTRRVVVNGVEVSDESQLSPQARQALEAAQTALAQTVAQTIPKSPSHRQPAPAPPPVMTPAAPRRPPQGTGGGATKALLIVGVLAAAVVIATVVVMTVVVWVVLRTSG